MLEGLTYRDGNAYRSGSDIRVRLWGQVTAALMHNARWSAAELWTRPRCSLYSDACARRWTCVLGMCMRMDPDLCWQTPMKFWKDQRAGFGSLSLYSVFSEALQGSHESCCWFDGSGLQAFIDFSLTSITFSCVLIQDEHAVERCWRPPADDPREAPDIARVFTGASRAPWSSRYTTVLKWKTRMRCARLQSTHMSLGYVRRSRTRRLSRIEGSPRASWSQGLDGT